MKALIFGAGGQLGRALAEGPAPAGLERVALTRADADFANPDDLRAEIERRRPDVVVNAAAYTAVDQAETEPDAAWTVNARAPGVLAAAARQAGASLIHISTDYVYDGAKDGAWTEADPVGPVNVYGASKLAGEIAATSANPKTLILRVSWVYAPWGKNFVRTMLRLGKERDALSIVDDQTGRPTYAPDLADAVWRAAKANAGPAPKYGVYCFSNTGPGTSWRGFAEAVFDAAEPWYGKGPEIAPIPTSDFPTPARRPLNSRMDLSAFERDFGFAPRDWRAALGDCIDALQRSGE